LQHFTFSNIAKEFTPLAVYPGISRDISILIKDQVSVQDIFQGVKEKAPALLLVQAI
jgi:phenylalanyl-tRNA synthetase beta subunit